MTGASHGSPADFQAWNPPDIEATFVYPSCSSVWAANSERTPPAQ